MIYSRWRKAVPLDVIIGAQWGDEGKGRITDLLSADADLVARFNGGDNAGHSVTVGDKLFKLHLVPSGIVQPHTLCLIGAGMAINPTKLIEEMDYLHAAGVEVSPERLKISGAAHIITPAHLALDAARESRLAKNELGTTRRGIGPTYTDKAARTGVRAEVMRNPEEFADQIMKHLQSSNEILEKIYQQDPLQEATTAETFFQHAQRLQPFLGEVGNIVQDALNADQKILAEGAQGTLLDIDAGTYPYVTSSHPTTSGALIGLGVGPRQLRRIIGVTKAFQTRVGGGPFPTELFDETASHLRGTGDQPWDEFGTTTGRPRRCGWLDGVLLRYAVRVNGFTEIALTKLDILTGLDPIRICVAYERGGETFSDLPETPANLASFHPLYEERPGWKGDITSARKWEDLPEQAQQYVQRIEELTGLPIQLISVGPERGQIVRRPVMP
jgi:adenylosuccinate synthase